MLSQLLEKSRSCRRFDHSFVVSPGALTDLITLTRFTPSGGNHQPLKYLPVYEKSQVERIFSHLQWARYLENWKGPGEHERPSAYIVLFGDTTITQHFQIDAGICAQTILLGATEAGMGGCILASVDRDAVKAEFNIPSHYELLLVIAIGKPAEKIVIEPVGPSGDIKYYRTPDGTHHVPKRSIDELIIKP